MYAMPEENQHEHPGENRNTDWSINRWLDGGARPDQLLLGIGLYGRGFRLSNPQNNGFYAPAIGGQDAGPYTAHAGYWGYNEYCEKMFLEGEFAEWTIVQVSDLVP